MKTIRICKVPNCNKSFYCKGFCARHYNQWQAHGKILNADRSKFDPNEITIQNDLAVMTLCNNRGHPKAQTIFDSIFLGEIRKYKWFLHNKGYVVSGAKTLFLHHIIIGKPPEGKKTDHINRNRLDNRKSNLRFVTFQQNNMNVSIGKNNTSGTTGVCWHRGAQKWTATIGVDGKDKYLGLYKDKRDAIQARKDAERKYFGAYAPKNVTPLGSPSLSPSSHRRSDRLLTEPRT